MYVRVCCKMFGLRCRWVRLESSWMLWDDRAVMEVCDGGVVVDVQGSSFVVLEGGVGDDAGGQERC